MKHSKVAISLPEPCTQRWDSMVPAGGGRHCTICRKTVVDFTTMTDDQLQEALRKTGSGCGRFSDMQLASIQVVAERKSLLRDINARVAATLLLLQSLTTAAMAQQREQTAVTAAAKATAKHAVIPAQHTDRNDVRKRKKLEKEIKRKTSFTLGMYTRKETMWQKMTRVFRKK